MLINRVILIASVLCLSGCLSSAQPAVDMKKSTPIKPSNFTEVLNSEHDPYPFVGCFYAKNGLIGSGVVIRPDVILTAAHVAEHPITEFHTTNGDSYNVKKVVLHPQYRPYDWAPEYIEHDIAVVFLDRPVSVSPVELLAPDRVIHQHTPITTIGYSRGVKKYSNEGVFWYYGRFMEEPEEVIFLPLTATVWFGDSGGAVVSATGGKRVLIGIISSFSASKGIIYENAAASVAYYVPWIEEVLNERLEELVR